MRQSDECFIVRLLDVLVLSFCIEAIAVFQYSTKGQKGIKMKISFWILTCFIKLNSLEKYLLLLTFIIDVEYCQFNWIYFVSFNWVNSLYSVIHIHCRYSEAFYNSLLMITWTHKILDCCNRWKLKHVIKLINKARSIEKDCIYSQISTPIISFKLIL